MLLGRAELKSGWKKAASLTGITVGSGSRSMIPEPMVMPIHGGPMKCPEAAIRYRHSVHVTNPKKQITVKLQGSKFNSQKRHRVTFVDFGI